MRFHLIPMDRPNLHEFHPFLESPEPLGRMQLSRSQEVFKVSAQIQAGR